MSGCLAENMQQLHCSHTKHTLRTIVNHFPKFCMDQICLYIKYKSRFNLPYSESEDVCFYQRIIGWQSVF